jgi:HDOD domain-containing protein
MFNPQDCFLQVSPRSLVFRQALAAAFKAHRQNIPEPPVTLPALLDACRHGLVDLMGEASCREALLEIRADLFHAPGRDADAQMRWHEAVVTAVFAARLAQLKSASGGVAFLAALLHRSGELLALRILARVELEHRIKLDSPSCLDWCSGHNEELTERLLRLWDLAPEIASCALGWMKYGEQAQVSKESAVVYFGRLFAIELLQPEFCVPGALEHAAMGLGLSDRQLVEVRAESAHARELIRMLD